MVLQMRKNAPSVPPPFVLHTHDNQGYTPEFQGASWEQVREAIYGESSAQ